MARVIPVLMACIAVVSPLWLVSASAEPARTVVAARDVVARMLRERAPSLLVGGVLDAGQSYEVEVVTSRGSLVDRLLVDKASGRLRSLYGRTLMSFAPVKWPNATAISGGT